MFYEQKMVNEIDTAKFADVGCISILINALYVSQFFSWKWSDDAIWFSVCQLE